MGSDLDFYFDPVCPFAWMTSKWVRLVAEAKGLEVGWRFISLRLVNREVDYAAHFPAGYDEGHTRGLRLLRVAAEVREQHGPAAVGRLYAAFGEAIFEKGPTSGLEGVELRAAVAELLAALGLDEAAAGAVDDPAHDALIQAETDRALSLTGKDVGTPILHFGPPEGTAFFGPVISRLPTPEEAVALWDHVTGLAGFAGFAELKRSLREVPQLPSFGVAPGEVGGEQDWRQGRRADAV